MTPLAKQVDPPSQPRTRHGSLRIAATAILISLTLFAGVVHGYLDGRWSANKDLNAVGGKLDELPEQVGEWKLKEATQLDPGAAKLLRCYGSSVRIYENQSTGALVNVALLFGPRGPIAVHTPEICYSSVGTNQIGERKVEQVASKGVKDALWSVQFAVEPNPDPSLNVWYAWSDGGPWEARAQPRFWLSENLYKIQVAGPVGDGASQPVEDFLKNFLPLTHPLMGS